MKTITAVFDSQPKPNHITMMGAMPMIGTALTILPNGRRPRCRNGIAVDDERGGETQQIADGEPGDHGLQERLPEIVDEGRQLAPDGVPDLAWRRQQHLRNRHSRGR